MMAATLAEQEAQSRADAATLARMRREADQQAESGYGDRLAALRAKSEHAKKKLAQAKEERASKRAKTMAAAASTKAATSADDDTAAASSVTNGDDDSNPFLDWRSTGGMQ